MPEDLKFETHLGDCREILPEMPENSVDAVVCDPQYGLSEHTTADIVECLKSWLAGAEFEKSGGGFMGKKWDAWVPGPDTWTAIYRVLKPGGYLLAFAGTRTSDLMGIAIRLAGFEIRDEILAWLYGQGFSKSLDIGRAIDMELCTLPGRHFMRKLPPKKERETDDHVCPETPEGDEHRGEGTGLKPSHEPIIVARKPLIGTVAQNVLEHGTGGMNIDGCRVGTADVIEQSGEKVDMPRGACHEGYDRPNATMFRTGKPKERGGPANPSGRWPSNILFTHHPDCKLIGTRKVKGYTINRCKDGAKPFGGGAGHLYESEQTPDGEVEVWECVEDCPVKELDRQSGIQKSGTAHEPVSKEMKQSIYGKTNTLGRVCGFGDKGGASRFFPCFRYEAKASKAERNAGCEHLPLKTAGECTDREDGSAGLTPRAGAGRSGGAHNHHPTLKPIKLMRWLVRLVCPRGGVVLDPFAGSFTTAIAAYEEGCSCIVVEKEPDYFEIGKARLAYARRQRKLF